MSVRLQGIRDLLNNPDPPKKDSKPFRWYDRKLKEFKLHSSTRESLGAGNWLQFPHPESEVAIRHVLDCTEGNFKFIKDSFFRKHCIRVKRTYKFWQKHIIANKPSFGSWRSIFIQNLKEGPAFAKRLNSMIQFSYRAKTGIAFYNFDEDVIDDEAWGFDYFPSPFHLFPFFNEEACDDFNLVDIQPKFDHELEDLFFNEASKHVRKVNYDIFLDDVDMLGFLTSKTCLVAPWKTESNLVARVRLGYPMELTDKFVFMEKIIYKGPHEIRACWIPNIPTLNTLKYLKKCLKEVLHSSSDYYYKRPSWKFLTEYLDKSYNTFFLMSDLKKSGLTFPFNLIEWAVDVLQTTNPKYHWEYLKGFYKAKIFCQDGKTTKTPKRGCGLGMADPLISWCLSVLFTIWKKSWDDDWIIHGMFWGDDQVIKVKPRYGKNLSYVDAAILGKDWDAFCKRAGLQIHETKPFVSTAGCLLETYPLENKDWDSLKRGQWCLSLFWALGCENITDAKQLTAAIYTALEEYGDMLEITDTAMEEIIAYWGYEFFKDEPTLPYELGGWKKIVKDGLNQFVQYMYALPPHLRGLARLPFISEGYMRHKSFKVEEDDKKLISGLGGPSYRRLVQSTLNPTCFRPSVLREQKVKQRLYQKRQKAFKTPEVNIYKLIFDNLDKLPKVCELPDEVLLKFERASAHIDISALEGYEMPKGVHIPPDRAYVALEDLVSNNFNPTLKINCSAPSMAAVQVSALNHITRGSTVLDFRLLKWVEGDPNSYDKQLQNLLSRGMTIHPNFLERCSNVFNPFFLEGNYLHFDSFSQTFFTIDQYVVPEANSTYNSCWTEFLKVHVDNIDLYPLSKEKEEERPFVAEQAEPLGENEMQLYLKRALEGCILRTAELPSGMDPEAGGHETSLKDLGLSGDYESDFALDEGIDFEALGIG